ncbi:hypothetical protein [Hymenobacter rubidus]|uniref:hypothetical protein n=1 Tax=Hymenobacter rubidus TaxID=1441626 RepID=UPI00191F07D3|nr:hypothetical protein [Hymenobacter rubidus]
MKKLVVGCAFLFGYLPGWAQSLPATGTRTAEDTAQRAADWRYRRAVYDQPLRPPLVYAPAGADPACVGGHRDHVIPIYYGLVDDAKILRQANRGQAKLGGCFVDANDPHYYCTRHQRYL